MMWAVLVSGVAASLLSADSALSSTLLDELDRELEKAAELVRNWQPDAVFATRNLASDSSYSYDFTDAPTATESPSDAPTEAPTYSPTASPTYSPTSYPTVACELPNNITFRVFFGGEWSSAMVYTGDFESNSADTALTELSSSSYESFCGPPNSCYLLNATFMSSSSDAFVRVLHDDNSLTTFVEAGESSVVMTYCVDFDGDFERAPTKTPTPVPTSMPSMKPTSLPTSEPTMTFAPTSMPTFEPTSLPTPAPTKESAEIFVEFDQVVPEAGTSIRRRRLDDGGFTSDEAVSLMKYACLDQGYEYALENVTQELYSFIELTKLEIGCDIFSANFSTANVTANLTNSSAPISISCTQVMFRAEAEANSTSDSGRGDLSTAAANTRLDQAIAAASVGTDSWLALVIEGIRQNATCDARLDATRRLDADLTDRELERDLFSSRKLTTIVTLGDQVSGSEVTESSAVLETSNPSAGPTAAPSFEPTYMPTNVPTFIPTTASPTTSTAPSMAPSASTACNSDDDCPPNFPVCDLYAARRRKLLFGYTFAGVCV